MLSCAPPIHCWSRILITIFNILAPVFAVIVLGWSLTAAGFLSGKALHDLNRISYWIALPSVLFYRIAAASPQIGAVADLLLVGVTATLGGVVVAALAAWSGGIATSSRGTFMQGVFRGNLAFVGLPVVLYALGETAASDIQGQALLLFGPMVVLYNVLAVLVLLLSVPGRTGIVTGAAYGLVTNPILIACLAGLALSLSGMALPAVAQRTLAVVGDMALPLALICIGGTLYTVRIQGSLGWAMLGALMKLFLIPGIGLALANWLALSADHTRIVLILLAAPTASASYILVRQLGGDTALASSMIVISNVLAIPALALVLALTG